MPRPESSRDARSASSGTLDRKVRVGVLVDGPETQVWAYEMLERIKSSSYAEIVQVVENTGSGDRRKSGIERVQHLGRRLAYSLISRIDRKLSRVRDDPFVSKSIRALLSDAKWIPVEPARKGFVDRFSQQDIEKMGGDNVDVYLRLGFGILKGEVLSVGRLGIWSYHHGDNQVNRGLPPGFWEIYSNDPVTGITLQVLGEELDAGDVLYRSYSKSNSVYVHRSISGLYWKSVAIVPRVLQKLHRLGIERFEAELARENGEKPYYTRPLYTYPTNWQTLRYFASTAYRLMCHKLAAVMCHEQWMLMYCQGTVDSPRTSLWRFKEIRPPMDRFWADPFVMTVNNVHHVFFEELIYSENKGTIAHLSIAENGEVSEARTVLEQPYHMSYPFVFEHEGNYYMIPESAANRSVDLYRCRKFPDEWCHVKTLIEDTELVDATVIHHDKLWWMFAGQRDCDRVSISEELSIFYTDDILNGTWTPHPGNPVVSDVRCARPAGKVFRSNGKLYRPSQDCRLTYGGAVDIRRIDVLTPERYEESHESRLDPKWRSDLVGVHTLNRTDGFTVIDVVSSRLKLARLVGSGR